jgi:signal transduction histidine kinase
MLSPLRSLTNRIFAATALLVVVAVGATAIIITDRFTTEAEAELQRGLAEAAAAVERRAETLTGTFRVMAQLVADLPRLKAALATGDAPTVRPVLAEYQAALGSVAVAVTDASGRVLAGSGIPSAAAEDPADWRSVPPALRNGVGITFRAHPQGVMEVVSVPVTMGPGTHDVAGTLSVGFLLDTRLADEFEALTGSAIAFGLGTGIRSSTIDRRYWPEVAAALHTKGPVRLILGTDEYIALSQPLVPGSARGAADDAGRPVVLVARSRTDRLRVLGTIRAVTGVTVAVAILAATGLSYALARSVTRPLAAITSVMKDVASTGDLTRTIPVRPGVWEDEDARLLAATFNTLVAAIGRFEREAAARERLSALGRLSSVLAHEIRNPLMIIKASVRTLKAPNLDHGTIEEAAADITGEVTRLDRLVHDVLDYAKPIRCDWQPADLNAVCRAAAAAVRAADQDAVIDLDLAPDLPAITSDAERVRTVLVNALTNAMHAVRAVASPANTPGRAPVLLRTSKVSESNLAVEVMDDGPGIDPAILPRVFEPFVTSRRGGTGLGLAIARNVVEGLGGTISLTNRAPSGAVLRLDLPVQPRQATGPVPASGAEVQA